MRVVIIGGSGLIGRALMKELLEHGHEVTLLSRSDAARVHPEYTQAQWDGKDEERLAELLTGQEAVVNLAGEGIGKRRWSAKRKQEILNSRLEPGRALFAAVNSMSEPPQVWLQASAIGYYGTGADIFTEESLGGEDWLADVCRQWETVLEGLDVQKVRAVVLRTGVVLAREGGVLAQWVLPFRFFVGGALGSGNQWISWIGLEDEVRAIRFLLEEDSCAGIYNLTAPEPISNREMGQTIAQVLHRPFWLPLPAFVLRFILGEMSMLVLKGQRVLPTRLEQAKFEFKFTDLKAALQNLFAP